MKFIAGDGLFSGSRISAILLEPTLPPVMTEGRIMKAFVLIAATVSSLAIFAADPAKAYTRRADKPPAGDCYELASRYGADRVWYGLYSGLVSLDYKGRELPYSNRGCFRTEADCRL